MTPGRRLSGLFEFFVDFELAHSCASRMTHLIRGSQTMTMSPTMRALLLVGALFPACGGVPARVLAQGATKALELAETNIIAAPRGEKLLMLINLEPQRATLKSMQDNAINDVLSATGKAQAARILDLERNRGKFAVVDVVFAFVSSMDEYNRPNFGGMTRLGTATFRKSDQSVVLEKMDLNFSLFKQ
jgi:hypothetical protein